jgi:predicted small lipoprotein YifL
MNFRPACLALLAACALFLNACGTKGPLTLPGETPTAKKQRAPAAAKTADDHNSTPTTPASR